MTPALPLLWGTDSPEDFEVRLAFAELEAERDRAVEAIKWVLAHGKIGKQSKRRLRDAI